MESKTYNKNLKIAPKKLRFLLPEIKKLKPVDALDYLKYTPRKSAGIFYKVIKSALNNAKNVLKVEETTLKFKFISVGQGQKLKRFRHGGRGAVKPILRRFSHIKITLEAEKPKEADKNQNPKSEILNRSKLTKSK